MNIEELRDYCLSMEGVTEKTPFGKFARRFDSVLVFYILDHMFCLTDMDDFTSVTVKAEPEVIEELKMTRSSVSSHRNMSERHWIQLNLNGDVSDRELNDLVQRSYEIVKAKYSGKRKKRITHLRSYSPTTRNESFPLFWNKIQRNWLILFLGKIRYFAVKKL